MPCSLPCTSFCSVVSGPLPFPVFTMAKFSGEPLQAFHSMSAVEVLESTETTVLLPCFVPCCFALLYSVTSCLFNNISCRNFLCAVSLLSFQLFYLLSAIIPAIHSVLVSTLMPTLLLLCLALCVIFSVAFMVLLLLFTVLSVSLSAVLLDWLCAMIHD